jgi:small subunit ribosomal protein S16e
MATPVDSVQVFGRKKTAVAVAYCKRGRGLIKINGCPVEFVQPEALRTKVMEPILLLGFPRFANVDIRIRVKGGGYTSQLYAIRQALGKSLVAFYQKCKSRSLVHRCAPLTLPSSAFLLVMTPRCHTFATLCTSARTLLLQRLYDY